MEEKEVETRETEKLQQQTNDSVTDRRETGHTRKEDKKYIPCTEDES